MMSFKRIIKIAENNMNFIAPAIVVFAIASAYTYLFWDKHYAKYVFDKACEEEGGIEIFEKIYLNNDFYIKNSEKLPANFLKDHSHFYGEYYLVDKKLESLFNIDISGTVISKYGPIRKYETEIKNKLNDDVLAKSIMFTSAKGRFLKSMNRNKPNLWECHNNYIYNGEKVSRRTYLMIETFKFIDGDKND